MDPKINNEIPKVIKEAVGIVFEQYFSCTPQFLTQPIDFSGQKTIISSLEFQGSIFGAVAMLIASDHATEIISKMLKTELETGCPDTYDGINEIMNILTGFVKTYLIKNGYQVEIALPFSTEGDNLEFKTNRDTEEITLRFSCHHIKFVILFVYKVLNK